MYTFILSFLQKNTTKQPVLGLFLEWQGIVEDVRTIIMGYKGVYLYT